MTFSFCSALYIELIQSWKSVRPKCPLLDLDHQVGKIRRMSFQFFLLNLGDVPDDGGQSFNIDILDTLLADPIAVRKLYFLQCKISLICSMGC